MEEKLVSYELAMLAKESGFDILCEFAYQKGEVVCDTRFSEHFNWNILSHVDASAPTQSLLQKWLRDKHEIHVFIIPCEPYSFSKYKDMDVVWIYDIYKPLLLEYGHQNKNEFLTYEDALDACLFECLGLINKN